MLLWMMPGSPPARTVSTKMGFPNPTVPAAAIGVLVRTPPTASPAIPRIVSLLIRRMPAANPGRPFPAYLYQPLWANVRALLRSRPLALHPNRAEFAAGQWREGSRDSRAAPGYHLASLNGTAK